MRNVILLSAISAMLLAGVAIGADGILWFGQPDSIPLVFRIDSDESIPVWIQTNPDVYAAAVNIPLSTNDNFITERLGGKLFKPFRNDNPPEGFDKGWDSAEIRKALPHRDKEGYTSQGILGFLNLYGNPNVPLHCEEPCQIIDYYVHTAADDSLKGNTYDILVEGCEYPSKGINLSDTLGIQTFHFDTYYSQIHFLYPGDINADFKIDKTDTDDLRLYLKDKKDIPWPELRGDCNNDGNVDEKDLEYLEAYINGTGASPK